MEKEIIESIDLDAVFIAGSRGYSNDGVIIKTNKQEIKIGIDNDQQCCESWGYLTSEDNVDDFIGAEVVKITLDDELLNESVLSDLDKYTIENASMMFVTVHTSKGPFQVVAYNEHNGYYGHTGVLISNQLEEEERL